MTEAVPTTTKTSKNDQQGLDKKTLFVRQIPFDATSEELSDFFSQFAPIRHAVVVTDKEKNSRGFGFVSFALDDDAQLALEQGRKQKFKGRLLRVDIAKRRERSSRTEAREVTKEDKEQQQNEGIPASEEEFFRREIEEKKRSRLIIRNLPWSIRDSNDLKKYFQRYGTVTECVIPRKKDGKMSGFGFVQLKKYSAAVTAVEKSKNLKIDGRQVAVDFALEKSKWEKFREVQTPAEKEAAEEGEDDNEEEENEDDDDKVEEEDEEDNSNGESDDESKEITTQEEQKPQRPKANKQEPYTVFIRNLPYDTTKETLQQHFEQFGPVKYALPVIDRETGLARGTGFVAFNDELSFQSCIDNAPDTSSLSSSLLLSDDVPAAYVFDGRILSITPAVNRERANVLKDKNSEKRAQLLGKEVGKQDKRNLYLLNEGRITPTSRLATLLSKTDLELREKSYKLRVDQLNKNPSLHLSFTRLAIRNLPRTLTEKSFKALGRKAVVEFATEVKNGSRQPLSKEEVIRSTKHKQDNSLEAPDSNKSKKKGVVRQAKILVEVNAGGDAGRSKGYGFLEFRDHKSALMALRYLNCHEVTKEEVLAGLTDDEKKFIKFDPSAKRRLIAEFAIEHAKVVKRRKDKVKGAREIAELKKGVKENGEDTEENEGIKGGKDSKKKGSLDKTKGGKAAKQKDGDAKKSSKRKHNEVEETAEDKTKNIIKNKRIKKNKKKNQGKK